MARAGCVEIDADLSSALWACYMMSVGLLLGPLTGGDPLRGLVAGMVMGGVSAGTFALVSRRWRAKAECRESRPLAQLG